VNCCQCQGIEELFNDRLVEGELSRFRAQGPNKTTRILLDALQREGVQGCSLLDIGGGVGAVQYGLLEAGCQSATDVDASKAYLRAAREEAQRRGLAERISYQHGNFVDLAAQVPGADIVTLDRVICCYPDMEKLVSLSAARAQKLYGLVFPRDAWWMRIGFAIMNVIFKLQHSSFRIFPHPTQAVEALVASHGLRRVFYHRSSIWQVVVYTR
jgi:2-polyprenyl-3-methyl-5-hydroxy-6-metoxy-1,4-benzoquinol methylase